MYNNYNRGGGNYRERSFEYDHADGYSRSNSYRSRGGGRYQGGQPARKHSGAKFGLSPKNGKPYVQGWNYSRRNGMMSFIASPAKNETTKSEHSMKWVVKVSMPGQRPYLTTGFYNTVTRKLTMPDLKMVANPQAPNGGYFGRFFQTRNRR